MAMPIPRLPPRPAESPIRAAPARVQPALAGLLAAVLTGAAGGWIVECRGEDRPRGLASGTWKLEVIELEDGRRLEGLVVDPTGEVAAADATDGVEFVQVVRSPGRPMHLIAWGRVPAARIRAIERLPAADRATLADRLQLFRERRDIRLERETNVRLARDGEDDPWRYAGRWFTLESTADPRLTREAIVRLEQVCDALEILVPAGGPRRDRLAVRLCGSSAEYRRAQEQFGIRAGNPAFYAPARRLLVAGSDMPAITEQQDAAGENLAAVEQRYTELDDTVEAGLRTLATDLGRQGIPAGKRAEIVQRARSRWERERGAALARIESARRENRLRVEAARRDFYAWLAHEAWHAHADGLGAAPLPLWLDEGLAQVIETAPLEAGELRLDAPDPRRLALLQEAIRQSVAPLVAEVINAGQEQFLVGHGGAAAKSRRNYLVAWGLAFHLALLEPVLTPQSLTGLQPDRDGADAPPRQDAVRHFETLVGMPVAAFEAAWRRRMLGLRPRAPIAAGESAAANVTPPDR
jgi:hypothetical protein